VAVAVSTPTGAIVSPALTPVKDGTGSYHTDLPGSATAAPGIYRYKWIGATPSLVQEGSVLVTDLMIAPRAIDLTDIQTIRSYCELQSDTDDPLIQIGISGFSMWMLRACGYGPADGTVPTTSPLVQPTAFNEWYNGNGSNRFFLRNSPIVSVASLTISGRVIPLSATWGQAGFVIEDNRKCLSLRAGGGMNSISSSNFLLSTGGMAFIKDPSNPQNINVQYTAGYAGVPFDLAEMAMRVVGQNFKRRQWIDLASKTLSAQGGSGTTRYRDWALSPMDELVLQNYKRVTY
jgi:hypothetical protein